MLFVQYMLDFFVFTYTNKFQQVLVSGDKVPCYKKQRILVKGFEDGFPDGALGFGVIGNFVGN